jgi:hypothetical protein
VLRLLGGIFTYAVGHKMRADNPVRGVPQFRDGQRERRLSGPEYEAFGRALAARSVNCTSGTRAPFGGRACHMRPRQGLSPLVSTGRGKPWSLGPTEAFRWGTNHLDPAYTTGDRPFLPRLGWTLRPPA